MNASRHGSAKIWVVAFILLVLGIGSLVWYFATRVNKPDFNLVGGTILLYEVDQRDRMNRDLPDDQDEILVQALQKRMDWAKLHHVTARSAGKGRVELWIARMDDHENDIQYVKDLVASTGSLEFRILANSVDDKQGIDAAKTALKDAKDLEDRDLEDRAQKGLPPPFPIRPASLNAPALFEISLPRGAKSIVSYSWFELGPQERRALNLDNAARDDPPRESTWKEAQRNISQATTLKDLAGKPLLQGALFFTRGCENHNLPDEERRHKEFEYFVLTRDPEIDPADITKQIRTPKIDGSYLVNAISSRTDLIPAVHFTFNNAGAELLGNITRKNVPSGSGSEETQVRRHLAIILDGLVMTAPTINSEIRAQGQISGSFTQKELDNLVNVLRAGALPVTLKPQPLSETTVAPVAKKDQ